MGALEIHLVEEGTVLSEGSKSSEKFIHGIKVLMAKNYIDNLSIDFASGHMYGPGMSPLFDLSRPTAPDDAPGGR